MHIERRNAWSDIKGAPGWFLNYLGRHLSVPVEMGTEKGTRFGLIWKHSGQVYGSLVHSNRVAAGLTPHVEKLAEFYKLPCTVRDYRVVPEDRYPWFSVTGNWRPYQDAVHEQCMRYETGVIDAPPRSGKTLMAARVIDAIAQPTLIVAPSVQIVRQTYEVLRSFYGESLVSRLDGSALPAEKDSSKNIVVATAQSAVRQPKEWFDTRGLMIIDEFHHAAAETYHKLNALADNIYYRYGFTGTHFRTGDDRLAMEAVCSRVLHKIHVSELVPKYLAPPHVFFAPTRAPACEGSDWMSAYKHGIVENETRNDLVVKIVSMLFDNNIPTLVLVRRRAHADHLGERIADSVVVKGGENALTSQSVKDFIDGRYQVLVGTTVLGEGVDVPRAGALVYASGGNDGVQMMQSYFRPLTAHKGKQVGRIYDFSDRHNRFISKHSDKRVEMAREQFGMRNVVVP